MELYTDTITFRTKGHTDIIDVTPWAQEFLRKSELDEGSILLFVVGSTAAITTIEFEPGLVKTDLPALLDTLAPYDKDYAHHDTWGDDNGAAHLRASLLGSSLEVPFKKKTLFLGTWQQIVLLDFDTRARSRELVIQVRGTR